MARSGSEIRVVGRDENAHTSCRHCAPACPLCVMKDTARRVSIFGAEAEDKVQGKSLAAVREDYLRTFREFAGKVAR